MKSKWVLEKDFTFEAAHQLPKHDGKCARLHGHSWKGTVRVQGGELVDSGAKTSMLLDYTDLKAAVQPLIDNYLDHYCLNDSLGLELSDPTSEEIARWVYLRVRHALRQKLDARLALLSVTIEETCTARCTYSEEAE